MQAGLTGLTLRGRAFLAAGGTAVICSILLGQSALMRIGVLVLALPLLAALVVGRRRHHIEVERSMSTRILTAGQSASVQLTLRNAGRGAPGMLLVEDRIPYALGTRTRFVLQGLGRAWERNSTYAIRSDVRGHFEIGPLSTVSADPFGLVAYRQVHPGTTSLVVTPRTYPLPPIPLSGGWTGAGDHRPQAFASGSAEDVSVREYRRGDELRRVHWRTSARMGELMVRREEQPWEARATVFLDNRLRAHRGQGLASSFEAAVSIAASVAAHLDQHGYAVHLATSQGGGLDAGETMTSIMESLALVQLEQHRSIDLSWSGEHTHGGLVIAVVGGLDGRDGPVMRRLRHDAGTALAFELDIERWAPTRGTTTTVPPGGAAAAGWRAITVGPRDRIDSAWRDLGRLRQHSGGQR